jgi:RND family efflux transporter MFP subunit
MLAAVAAMAATGGPSDPVTVAAAGAAPASPEAASPTGTSPAPVNVPIRPAGAPTPTGRPIAAPVMVSGVVDAITKPSVDVQMAFVHPGRIAQVAVRQGDLVKTGDVLMRLDDEAERVEVATLKLAAEDVIRIHAAEAQAAQKAEDLKKLEWAQKEGAATQWEVEHARLEVIIGEMSTALAKFNQAQDQGKFQEAAVNLDRMKLVSPMNGKIEQVIGDVGQAADVQTKVIRIVNTELLWSDVPVPLPVAVSMRVGQRVPVEFPGYPNHPGWTVGGKIISMGAVADPASDTMMIRVEITNPAGRPAGERVKVRFTSQMDVKVETKQP